MKSDLLDIDVEIVHQTDKAVLVDDGVKKVWLPKSLIELEPKSGKIYTLTLPERIAADRGLI